MYAGTKDAGLLISTFSDVLHDLKMSPRLLPTILSAQPFLSWQGGHLPYSGYY